MAEHHEAIGRKVGARRECSREVAWRLIESFGGQHERPPVDGYRLTSSAGVMRSTT
ncbi:MAG: hypothetical protein ACR2GP_14470 [Burkholderiaceae bacterium]